MLSLPSLAINVKFHFPLESNIKQTTNSFCPMTHANGTLMFKTSSKSNLQCVTNYTLGINFNTQLCVKLTTCTTIVNFSFQLQMLSITSMQCVENGTCMLFFMYIFEQYITTPWILVNVSFFWYKISQEIFFNQ